MAVVLGIETSCDDAAVALVEDGTRVLGETLASQADDFAAWGGVVPEIAARGHVLALPGLVERVLAQAGLGRSALAAVAVSAWPGLVGSLVTGVTCAKVLAARLRLPLLAVDHIQAHLAAIHLAAADAPSPDIAYPLVGLVASGGHSHLWHCRGPGQAELLGGTIDDAAGEAFDKCATVLGLGYPGGPAVDRLAEEGDPAALALPRPLLGDGTLRLSFAGLKTALLYHARGREGRGELRLDAAGVRNACAAFRAAVVDCLVDKALLALARTGAATLAVGGGVACNRALRRRLEAACTKRGTFLHLPAPRHCADNAAMVAALGFHQWRRGETAGLDLAPRPTGRAGPRAAAG
jgi:N6-L-threonylcarbamoyladenine synthase